MSSFYSLTKLLKACLFTTVLYGWLVPTVWMSDHLNNWFPTRQLKSTDWVIESGQQNTSWDLVTTDSTDTLESSTEDAVHKSTTQKTPTAETKTNPSSNSQTGSEGPESTKIEDLSTTEGAEFSSKVIVQSPRIAKSPAKGISSHPTNRFTSKRKIARQGKCKVENPNITKSGKNTYTLPKSILKHYSTHWKEASRLAHLSWAMKSDGSRLGIRLRGISCRSPLKFTGLRHGDVVVAINDHAVQSEKDLLNVYSRMLFWKKVNVKVKRGSRTFTLKYNIA